MCSAQVAAREQAAVDLRVQRLDAAVEHLGKAGVLGDLGDREAGVGEQLGRAAGRQQLDAERRQLARELDDAGLVGNGDQRLHRSPRGRAAARASLDQLVLDELAAQRVAVDAEPFGGAALVAARPASSRPRAAAARRRAGSSRTSPSARRREVLEVALQAVADALLDVLLVAHGCSRSSCSVESAGVRARRARAASARVRVGQARRTSAPTARSLRVARLDRVHLGAERVAAGQAAQCTSRCACARCARRRTRRRSA